MLYAIIFILKCHKLGVSWCHCKYCFLMKGCPCHYLLVQKDPHLLLTSELRLPRFIILCIAMTSRSEYELPPRISKSKLIGKYNAKAATSGVPWKKVFLEISQNSKENTCTTVSFLIKLQACNFIKKDNLAQVFSCEFCEISQNTFFYRTPLDDCFWI